MIRLILASCILERVDGLGEGRDNVTEVLQVAAEAIEGLGFLTVCVVALVMNGISDMESQSGIMQFNVPSQAR